MLMHTQNYRKWFHTEGYKKDTYTEDTLTQDTNACMIQNALCSTVLM